MLLRHLDKKYRKLFMLGGRNVKNSNYFSKKLIIIYVAIFEAAIRTKPHDKTVILGSLGYATNISEISTYRILLNPKQPVPIHNIKNNILTC